MSTVLGFASLRLLLGLVCFGYSLLKADFGEGGGVSNEILKSIVAHTFAAANYEIFKGGIESALEQFAKSLQRGDNENLNHDLQQAARKAQLSATLLAVRACLTEVRRLKEHKKSFWSKASGLLWENDDEKWLNKLIRQLQEKIDKLPREFMQEVVERDNIISLFDTRKDLSSTDIQKQLVKKLKEDTCKEIRVEYYSAEFSNNAYQLVEEAIRTGWNEPEDDNSSVTRASLYPLGLKQALIKTDRQYDWFSLVCGFFSEEYKINSRVTNAMQKYLLLDIRDRQDRAITSKDGKPIGADLFIGHLRQFSDSFVQLEDWLKRVDVKQDEILGYVKALIRIEKTLDLIDIRTERIPRLIKSTEEVVIGKVESVSQAQLRQIEQLKKMIEGLGIPESQFRIESVIRSETSVRTIADESHLKRIRDYAHCVVNTLSAYERLSLEVELKAKCDSRPTSLSRLLEEHARLVITGTRGMGKTTFMKQKLRSLWSAVNKKLNTGTDPSASTLLVPVYIELDQLSDRTHPETSKGAENQREKVSFGMASRDLVYLLLDNLGYENQEISERTFMELLDACKVVLFLDGLNELSSKNQDRYRTELFRLDQKLMARGKKEQLRVVLSSRIHGFEKHSESFEQKGWKFAEIVPLELQDIERELLRAFGPTLGRAVFRQSDAKYRQQLSTTRYLHYFINLGKSKIKEASQKNLDPQEVVKDIVRPVGTLLKSQVDTELQKLKGVPFVENILTELAYKTVTIATAFPYSEALGVTNEILQRVSSKGDGEKILEKISKTGLLVIFKSKDLCRFEHPSVQEYFAACKMQSLWKLDEYLTDARWREPLAIMAGILKHNRLLELLEKVRPDPKLYAYILAHTHEPETEQQFKIKIIERFVEQTRQWATGIARWLRFLFTAWFLFIPLLAYFLSQLAGSTLKVQIFFSCVGLAYFFIFPLMLIRWNNRQFQHRQERLRDHELSNLVEILRTLQARGAMELARQKLTSQLFEWDFDEEDPRKVFVRQAITKVREAVTNSTYLTQDEMLEKLGDPLVAASIPLENLSISDLEWLYKKALDSLEDSTGMNATDKLMELYSKDPDCRERVAETFITIARNVNRRYSRRRQKHAVRLCRKLGISLKAPSPQRSGFIAKLLALLKRFWYTQG